MWPRCVVPEKQSKDSGKTTVIPCSYPEEGESMYLVIVNTEQCHLDLILISVQLQVHTVAGRGAC